MCMTQDSGKLRGLKQDNVSIEGYAGKLEGATVHAVRWQGTNMYKNKLFRNFRGHTPYVEHISSCQHASYAMSRGCTVSLASQQLLPCLPVQGAAENATQHSLLCSTSNACRQIFVAVSCANLLHHYCHMQGNTKTHYDVWYQMQCSREQCILTFTLCKAR